MPILSLLSLLIALSAPQKPFGLPAEAVLGGLDPVALCEGAEVPGSPALTREQAGFLYRFRDEASRARFDADPGRFGVQWGGACGRMGPLSGLGSGERFAVHDGRIWLFASDGCRSGFLSAPERFAGAAPEPELASREALEAGSAWVARAVDAHGGEAAVDAAGAVTFVGAGESGGWREATGLVLARDGRVASRSSWTPPADSDSRPLDTRWVLRVPAEESVVFEALGDERSLRPVVSADQHADLHRSALREPLAILWARHEVGFEAADLGEGELAGKPVRRVRVRARGLVTTLLLDPRTGRIEGLAWTGRVTDGAQREVVERFTRWTGPSEAAPGQLALPLAREVSVDGEPNAGASRNWISASVLSEPDETAFSADSSTR